jgi:endonuclease G, mitochondrial
METMNDGYRKNFLGKDYLVKPPVLNSKQEKDLVRYEQDKYVLNYVHYSVVMSKMRRFAYYTAVNIDGTKWQNNPRNGRWKKDNRIKEQFGNELYSAPRSNFDKGHLVRREDPEWGDIETAIKAGESTFVYPNCVPQHKRLNREIWEELENNILHKGAIGHQLKISVFTGPVLLDSDGVFISKVNSREVKIPNLFWKIVTWVKTDGNLYAVGFVQSQEKFLVEEGIITKPIMPSLTGNSNFSDDDIFEHLKFSDGNTYQVRIEEIEILTGLKFDWPGIIKPYTRIEPAMIMSRKPDDRFNFYKGQTGYRASKIKLILEGLVLG